MNPRLGADPGLSKSTPGACPLLILLVFATLVVVGCQTLTQNGINADQHTDAATDPRLRSVTPEEKAQAEALLRRTAAFRRNDAHPEWEKLTTADFTLPPPYDIGVYTGFPSSYVQVKEYELQREHGPRLGISFDARDKRIRAYQWESAENLVAAEKEAGRVKRPTLTPAQAVDLAKSYIEQLMGKLPDDLVVDYVYVPGVAHQREEPNLEDLFPDGGTGYPSVCSEVFWEVRFTRHAGRLPFDWQGVLIRFSEQHGVERYLDLCFDRWEGRVKVGIEQAIRAANEALEGYPLGDPALLASGESIPPVLRLPLYVEEGHPFLMNVVEESPRAVHAVWKVVLRYAILWKTDLPGPLHWRRLTTYVDAETGKASIVETE